MRPSLTFSISLIIAAHLHTAIAQSSPAPTPVTLRSLLVSELLSTHDNAEWFTPANAAVAGLTAEQARHGG